MERKLASIRKIAALNPIEGADKIEVATVDGWKVVAEKGLHKVGDLVVYCEIDSWIPTEIAPFLSKGQEPKEYNGVKGERLRTVKLRGQISQGLLLPLSILGDIFYFRNIVHPNRWERNGFSVEHEEGSDATEYLGIQKYESPIPACLAGKVKGPFPNRIPRTDEERIQNLTAQIEDLSKELYIVTEKLDGTSCTIYIMNGEFGVCSRNLDLYETDDNTLWKLSRALDLETKMKALSANHGNIEFAIQCECIGEGIQGNKYKIKGHEFRVFNVYNITDRGFFSFDSVIEICNTLGIGHVPVIHTDMEISNIEDVLKSAKGKSAINAETEREGLVFKTCAREVSFKAISNKFLAKEK